MKRAKKEIKNIGGTDMVIKGRKAETFVGEAHELVKLCDNVS